MRMVTTWTHMIMLTILMAMMVLIIDDNEWLSKNESLLFSTVKTCSDMEKAANLLVGEIVLSALGLVFNLAGAFLGFMTVCCGPWQVNDSPLFCVSLTFPRAMTILFQEQSLGIEASFFKNLSVVAIWSEHRRKVDIFSFEQVCLEAIFDSLFLGPC